MKKLILIFLLLATSLQAQWFVPNPKGLLKLNNTWTEPQTFDIAVANFINSVNMKRVHQIYGVGDSHTSYGTFLAKLDTLLGSNWKTNNAGSGGRQTSSMDYLFARDVTDQKDAEYVTIMGGVNDALASVPASSIIGFLQSMYTKGHDAGVKVIAMTIMPCKGYTSWTADRQIIIDSVNNWIMNDAINIDYTIDAYTLFESPTNPDSLNSLYNLDGIHLNPTGYLLLGQTIYNTVTWTALDDTKKLHISNDIFLNQSLRHYDSPEFDTLTLRTLKFGVTQITSSPTQINYLSGSTGTTGTENVVLSNKPTLDSASVTGVLYVGSGQWRFNPTREYGIYYQGTGVGYLASSADYSWILNNASFSLGSELGSKTGNFYANNINGNSLNLNLDSTGALVDSVYIGRHTILVNCGASDSNIVWLSDYNITSGQRYVVKKIDVNSTNVIVKSKSGYTIDGAISKIWNTQYQTFTFVYRNKTWYIL